MGLACIVEKVSLLQQDAHIFSGGDL